MNREDLYEGFKDIDDDILERSEQMAKGKKKSPWVRWGAMAACICLVVAGAVGVHFWRGNQTIPPTPVDPIIIPPDDSGLTAIMATSDTYQTLNELLEYLSTNDYHASTLSADGGNGAGNISATSQQLVEGKRLAACDGYAYHAGRGQVHISELDSQSPIGSIDFEAEQIFVCGDRLVLVDSFVSGGSEIDEEISACVRLYDLNDPKAPKLMDEFVQLGSIIACYVSGDDLFLLTADGVCACGWSRLDDTDDYVPALSKNGAAVTWPDEEICILGEPTSVQYVAATQINVKTGEVANKQAFYGDIAEVFYGAGWLAITTQTRTEQVALHPDIYTFSTGSGYAYTGKISTASLLGLDSGVKMSDGTLPAGNYPYVKAVTQVDGVYRIIGEYVTVNGGNGSTQLLALTANMAEGESNYELIGLDNGLRFDLDDLLWESDRAIATVSTTELFDNDVKVEAQFIFAEFSGMDVSLSCSGIRADAVSGVDGIFDLGDPFGELETLIPMGNGIYLRYNETPDGLDIYDFSDSDAPQQIYDSLGDIPTDCRFEFTWEVYGKNIFGIMVVTPDENGEYRNATFSWNIYAVDVEKENPYTLLKAYPFGKGSNFMASSLGFETLEYEGSYYCSTMDALSVQKLTW